MLAAILGSVLILSATLNVAFIVQFSIRDKRDRAEREKLYQMIKASSLTEVQSLNGSLKSNKPQNWLQNNIKKSYQQLREDDTNES